MDKIFSASNKRKYVWPTLTLLPPSSKEYREAFIWYEKWGTVVADGFKNKKPD